jgi:hypothetical protein
MVGEERRGGGDNEEERRGEERKRREEAEMFLCGRRSGGTLRLHVTEKRPDTG